MAFLQCRSDDKSAILLHLLENVVKSSEQIIVFAATKHHVEFLNMVWFFVTCCLLFLFVILCDVHDVNHFVQPVMTGLSVILWQKESSKIVIVDILWLIIISVIVIVIIVIITLRAS